MEKNRRPMQRTEDESVIVGRNPVMELLKSGRDVEKLYIQKGEREGSITLRKQKSAVSSSLKSIKSDSMRSLSATRIRALRLSLPPSNTRRWRRSFFLREKRAKHPSSSFAMAWKIRITSARSFVAQTARARMA